MSPSGKASAFGADIRGFESLHPSQAQARPFGRVFACHGLEGIRIPECTFGGENSQWLFESDVPMTTNRQ
jgi:hypothetical protein